MMSIVNRFARVLPDKLYIEMMFFRHFGYFARINAPRTFNEKLQWLKLYDHNPLYTTMVDKVKAKDYVASIIGSQHIIPTLGVWESAESIDFSSLPNQFVIKCNHDSHGVIVCSDKTQINEEMIRQKLERRLNSSGYYYGREWPYKNVEKRIIAEEFISDGTGELSDYKVHCFGGVPKVILVCRDRFSEAGLKEDFYDTNWNHLEVGRPGTPHGSSMPRPDALEEMLGLAECLSRDIPFLRTDFYCVHGKVLFGELTLFPASGFTPFVPHDFDKTMGEWLSLPGQMR